MRVHLVAPGFLQATLRRTTLVLRFRICEGYTNPVDFATLAMDVDSRRNIGGKAHSSNSIAVRKPRY
jgi:hypothetical protein